MRSPEVRLLLGVTCVTDRNKRLRVSKGRSGTGRTAPHFDKERIMAIELRALPRFTFPSKTGGPQTQALTVGFSTLPRSAVAAINGFSIGYTNSDHHLLREEGMSRVLLNF